MCWTAVNDGAIDVDSGHGTHVATSVLGGGGPGGEGAGTAPGASLIFQAVEDWAITFGSCAGSPDNYYLIGIPDDIRQLFQQAYDGGARVHTNSWGSDVFGDYTLDAANADDFVWDNPDMTILFSAGNAGVDANANGVIDSGSMGSPGTAKNVITVGASENDRGGDYPCDSGLNYGSCGGQNSIFTYGAGWPADYPANPIASDPSAGGVEQMAAFSSRGPTDDGRIKPDVVAPGTWVLSGYSDLFQRDYDPAVNPQNGLYQYDGWGFPMSAYYKYMGGTSMATPLTAGGVAVLRDFYDDVYGHDASAALIKATLINSAFDMADENNDGVSDNAFPIPNVHEGWGLVDLDNATDGSHQYVDDAIGVGTAATAGHSFDVAAGGDFRVSLVWSDFPSTAAAATNLVNDLDLVVTAPDGTTTYLGNVFSGGWSTTGGAADATNNVENVYVANAPAGTWAVDVIGANVPNGPQPFALVVDADFAQGGTTGPDIVIENVTLSEEFISPGEIFTLTYTVTNAGDEAITASYLEGVYLSDDPIPSEFDIVVAVEQHEEDLAPGQSLVPDVTVFTDLPAIAPGTWYLIVAGDEGGDVAESDETNNLAVLPFTYTNAPDGPDIVIENATLSEEFISPGEPFTLSYTVTNAGGETITDSYLEGVYLSDDPIPSEFDIVVAVEQHDDDLAPGQSLVPDVTVFTDLPAIAPGTWYLIVAGDEGGDILEWDETNNLAVLPFTYTTAPDGQDIVIENLAASKSSIVPEEIITLSWTVTNAGGEPITNSYLEGVYLSPDPTPDITDAFLGVVQHDDDLAPGQSLVPDATIPAGVPAGTPPGTWYFIVVGDDGGDILEIDETNNFTALPITVTSGANTPDIVIENLTASPTTQDPGGVVNLQWTVTNAGTGTALGGYLESVYLSADPTLDGSDTHLQFTSVHSDDLAPGQSLVPDVSELVLIPPGTAPGAWYLLVEGDAGGGVLESDETNNVAAVPITVNVPDTTPPVVTPSADVTAEATGPTTPVSLGPATATDDVDGQLTPSADNTSPFPLGVTVVTWSATDSAGNTGTATQNVTVSDTTAPSLTQPGDITDEATSASGAVVNFGLPGATDLVDPSPNVTASPASGSTFALGGTTVTVTATDATSNSSQATFTVTVEDTTPPTVTPPAGVSVEATGPTTAVSLSAASATDAVDGALTPTADNTGPFSVDVTTVTWSATDVAGNTGSATQTVTVTDTTPPTVTPPADVTVSSTGTLTAVDLGVASASDLVDGTLAPTVDDPGPFPVGTTTVTWSAIDNAGNTGTATQDVTVTEVATMHLGDLDGAPSTRRNQWWVTVTVTVHDGGDSLVANATVSGSWSGASSGAGSCVTNGTGQCDVVSEQVHKKNDGMTFTVSSVSHATNGYTASANHDPDGDSDGTAITVTQSGTPSNQPPTANAGPDQTVTDADESGSEPITLDGSGSSDSDGSIVSYDWSEGGSTIATGVSPTVTLGVGAHTITLTVTDDGGATGADQVTVVVASLNPSDTAHVGDLDGSATGQKGQWQATVTVTVHDAAEQAVGNAVVSGNWSGGFTGVDSCTIGANDQCSVTSDLVGKKNASITFTVSGVTEITQTYEPSANHDPDGDSNGVAITVNKP